MRRLVGWLPLLHGLALLSYLVARRWITNTVPVPAPERAWWALHNLISLLNEFTPFFFVPLPLWLATAWVARTRSAVLVAALPWLIFGWLYGERFLPRPAHTAAFASAAADGAAVQLRVMTFNVLWVNTGASAVAETIQQANPDVVTVQELGPDVAQALDALLAPAYPYRRLRPAARGLGAGIWSRYPIRGEEAWPGSRQSARWQHATLAVGDRTLHVLNLHLTPPAVRWRARPGWPVPLVTGEVTEGRSGEVAELVPRLRALVEGAEPVVVAGDLNLTDQTPEYRRLLEVGLADAYRGAGWGFGHTFPAGPAVRIFRRRFPAWPLLRLDYVLHSPRLAVRRVRVWPASGGSDHYPVVADLVVVSR